MKIGIDIDGVMADFTKTFTSLAVSLGLTDKVTHQAIQPTWHFDFPMSPVWDVIDETYNWWMTLPPLIKRGEIENLNRVVAAHDVYFITSRKNSNGFTAAKQTDLWLQSIGVHTHHAHVITSDNKGALCAALGITDMLDDNVPNLNDLRAHGITAWCRSWLYNKGEELPCGSVDDFLLASGAWQ